MRVEIDDIWNAAVELRLSTVEEMCPNVTPADMICYQSTMEEAGI